MSSTTDDVVVRLRLQDVSRFIRDVRSGRLSIEDLERRLTRAGQSARRESGSAGGLGLYGAAVGRLKYAMFGLSAAALTGGGALARFSITATARLEQVEVGFKTLLGSQGAADKMIGKLQDFAEHTPFQLTDLEKQTQRLLGFGMTADAVIPSLTAMGNAVSAMGGTPDDLNGIILAMGQIATKGKLYSTELLQLSERNINARQYLMDAMKVNGPELNKLLEQGKISSGTAIPIILSGMQSRFKGAMEAQSTTLLGIFGNIKDRATREITDRMKPFRPVIVGWLTELWERIPEIADSIAGAIGKAAEMAKKTLAVGSSVIGKVKTSARTGGAEGLGETLSSPIPGLADSLLDKLHGAGKDVDWFNVGTTVGKAAVGFIFGFLKGLFDLGAWGDLLKDHWLDVVIIIASIFPVGKLLGFLGKVLSKIPILKVFAPMFEKAGAGLTKIGGPVWRLFGRIGKAIWQSFQRVFPELAFQIEYRLLRLGEIFGRTEHGIFAKVKRWALRIVNTIVVNVLDSAWKAVGKLTKSFHGLLLTPLLGLIPQVRDWAKDLWHSIPEEFGKALARLRDFKFTLPGGLQIGLDSLIPGWPGAATGGTVTRAGMTLVGERGPEALSLPRGASIIPLPRLASMGGGGAMPPIDITLALDGEVLMRRVIRRQDTAVARL